MDGLTEPEKKRVAFFAHFIEDWNWLLWFSKSLHKHPENAWRWLPLWPIYKSMSLLYKFGNKSHDVVDRFYFGDGLSGQIVLLRNMAAHFNNKKKIKDRIIKGVLAIQKEVDVIGLGALIKAEWLTRGGEWIIEALGDDLKVPLVHGDTCTAATVFQQFLETTKIFKFNSPVFITGATSKIGRAVVISLARSGVEVIMHTNSRGRFNNIKTEAGDCGHLINYVRSIEDGKAYRFWITGKAIPAGKELLRHIPLNAVVLNFSVPNPLSERDLKSRPDIRAAEVGLLAYNTDITDLRFHMRLRPGITYACHAGTMVHAYKGWTHNEVGQVDMSQLDIVWQAAMKLGFFLPELSFSPITERTQAAKRLFPFLKWAKNAANMFF